MRPLRRRREHAPPIGLPSHVSNGNRRSAWPLLHRPPALLWYSIARFPKVEAYVCPTRGKRTYVRTFIHFLFHLLRSIEFRFRGSLYSEEVIFLLNKENYQFTSNPSFILKGCVTVRNRQTSIRLKAQTDVSAGRAVLLHINDLFPFPLLFLLLNELIKR